MLTIIEVSNSSNSNTNKAAPIASYIIHPRAYVTPSLTTLTPILRYIIHRCVIILTPIINNNINNSSSSSSKDNSSNTKAIAIVIANIRKI